MRSRKAANHTAHTEFRVFPVFRVCLLFRALVAFFVFAVPTFAAEQPEIRVGVTLDFQPYDFVDKDGQAAGFCVELIHAVADRMGLRVRHATGPWDDMWNGLVAGKLDVLPTVASTPGREPLVDFSVPHTETFDAFFRRTGDPALPDLAAAAGMQIVVLRSDAAHHQLVERKFDGKIITVELIADGLRLIAEGKYDAMLCSKLVGVLELEQAGIKGVQGGPLIPDYKRVFSFAVRKGETELVEKLNQGLRIIKADGTYDRLYRKWLGVEKPQPQWQTYFWQATGILGVLVLIALTWVTARKAIDRDCLRPPALELHPHSKFSAFWPYALAVLAVAASYAMRVGLEAWVGSGLPTFVTFYPAIMVAALLGGTGPGLLATAVAAVITAIWIMPPIGQFWFGSPVDRLSLVLFCSMGVFMTAVAELHRRNRAKAAAFDREEALRETRREKELLADLIEAAEQPFAVGYPDGRIGLMNRAYEQLTGYSAADLERLAWSTELTPPEWRDHERKKLEELHRTGGPVRYEKEYIRKDGTRVPIELLVSLRRDEAGRLELYYAFITDITERKRAEEALRASEQRLRLALKATRMLAWDYDPATRKVGTSENADEVLALSPGQRLENSDQGYSLIHPDDVEKHRALVTEAIRNAGSYISVYRQVRDGEVFWLEEHGQSITNELGRTARLFGVTQNITARKQGEEEQQRLAAAVQQERDRLSALVNSITDEIWFADAEKKITLVNPAVWKEFGAGVGDAGEVEKVAASFEVYRGDGTPRPVEEAPPLRALKGETVHEEDEIVRTPATGELRHRQVNAAPVCGPDGSILGSVSVVRDITERKRAEEAVRASLREKEVLLNEIHHRVKNNMQVISSLVDLQADELEDASMRSVLKDVTHRVRSMALVHEKLYQSADLARVELVEYTESLLGYLWRAHGSTASSVRLALDLEPVSLPVDTAVPYGLILNELVINALKHAFRGRDGGEVSVALRADTDSKVRLCVRDDGVGLPEGFDWKQARSLGLHLVQMLSKQLRATVEVGSIDGTEFKIEFKGSKI